MQVYKGKYVPVNDPTKSIVVNPQTSQGLVTLWSGTVSATTQQSDNLFLENALKNQAGYAYPVNAVYMYWEVTNITGGTSPTIDLAIFSSASASSGYSQILHTGAQSAVGKGALISVVPVTSQYLRYNLTVTGTPTGITGSIKVCPFYIGPMGS